MKKLNFQLACEHGAHNSPDKLYVTVNGNLYHLPYTGGSYDQCAVFVLGDGDRVVVVNRNMNPAYIGATWFRPRPHSKLKQVPLTGKPFYTANPYSEFFLQGYEEIKSLFGRTDAMHVALWRIARTMSAEEVDTQ